MTRPSQWPRGARSGAGRHFPDRRALISAVAIAALLVFPARFAWSQEAPGALEQRVKAAFLYQFAGYVEWPPAAFIQPDTPITIGVIAAEGLAAELEKLVVGRTVAGRRVIVRRLRTGESLAGVHIVFVGESERARLNQVARSGQGVLTVTESDGALAQGSVINFVVVDRRVRFEIALDTAEKSGLKLSSRLLAVAQDVRTGAR